LTWGPASVLHAASADEAESLHEHRRRVLADIARRMFTPA